MSKRGIFRTLLFLIFGGITWAAPCPITPNDGGPYTIGEGNALVFTASPSSTNGPIVSMGWDFGGGCYLGQNQNLSVPRAGTPVFPINNTVQNCLTTAFGSDGTNTSFPGGIVYTINDGVCILTGSIDLIFNNTLPTANFSTSCIDDLQGTVPFNFQAFDPANDDYPLAVDLIADDGGIGGPQIVGSTMMTDPLVLTSTINLDTTTLDDGVYTFFLDVQDDTGASMDSIGCTIANSPASTLNQPKKGGVITNTSNNGVSPGEQDNCPYGDESGDLADGTCETIDDTNNDEESDVYLEEVSVGNNLMEVVMLIVGLQGVSDVPMTPATMVKHTLDICSKDSGETCEDDEGMICQDTTREIYHDLCPIGNTLILLDVFQDILGGKEKADQESLMLRALSKIDTISPVTWKQLDIDKKVFTDTLLRTVSTQEETQNDKVLQDVLDRANQTIETFKTHIENSEDSLCPPELVAQLLAAKASLEAEAQALSQRIKDKEKKLRKLSDDIDKQKKDIMDKEQDIKDQKDDAQDKQDDIDDLDEDISDLDQEIKDEQKAVQKIQDTLTNEDDITEHVGDKPLDKIESGAAISFDGGASWVVAHGESGVEKLTGKFDGLRSVIDKLQEHEKNIRDKKKLKKDKEEGKKKAEEEKNEIDNKIKENEKKLNDIKKKLEEDKKKQKACEDELTKLKAMATKLNDKINVFNAAAEKCGVEAGKAYTGAKKKLDQMPPDEKKTAQKEFKESLTEEEEDAVDDPSGDKATGGSGLGGAAKKLENAMKNASNCPPPHEKRDGPYRESQSTKTINGADNLYIINSKGTRGLADKSQKDIMKDLMTSANATNDLSTIQSRVEFGTSGNPVSLAYGYFQSAATKAIFDKLKQRQREGTLSGFPEWIEIYYGPTWKFDITRTKKRRDVYVCEESVRQKSHSEYDTTTDIGECIYNGDGRYTYTVNDSDLNLKGCTLGSCPNAWADAIKIALRKTLEEKVKGGMIASCNSIQADIK